MFKGINSPTTAPEQRVFYRCVRGPKGGPPAQQAAWAVPWDPGAAMLRPRAVRPQLGLAGGSLPLKDRSPPLCPTCRLISGMHSSITAHICGDYLIDEATQTWGAHFMSAAVSMCCSRLAWWPPSSHCIHLCCRGTLAAPAARCCPSSAWRGVSRHPRLAARL